LTSINSGIVTVNKLGEILSINRSAREILAIDSENLVSKPYVELFGADSEFTAVVTQTLSEGKNIDYREIDFTPVGQQKLTLGVSISAVCDNQGQPIGASVLINDLTELQRLRMELETKNRMAALGEMAGGLAHQLRNSMGAITGYCNLLKKRLKKSGLEIGSIAALIQETTETERLVERFLQFARPLTPSLQQVSVNKLIGDVIDAFQVRPDCRQTEFVVKQDKDITAELDSLLIKQVLTNIIENAVNAYENRRGLVEIIVRQISLTPADNWQKSEIPALQLNIEVKDFGCGIAEDDRDKIFTPFFSSRPSGTGLGLPLARKIIDLHRGSLTLKSQLGSGTTFTISLPVQNSSSRSDSESRLSSMRIPTID